MARTRRKQKAKRTIKQRSPPPTGTGSPTKVSEYPGPLGGSTCAICGKVFQGEHRLRIHVRTHTGETPYACSHCPKAFAQKAALKVHERTHTGERPFACLSCDKTFARADHLSQHARTHTGEKPLSCESCGRAFATWSALSRHKLEHTAKHGFSCSVCKKTFSRSDNLRTHLTKAHNGNPASDKKKGKPVKPKKAQTKVAKEQAKQAEPRPEELIAKILEDEDDLTMPPVPNDTHLGESLQAVNDPVTNNKFHSKEFVQVQVKTEIHDDLESGEEMFGAHFLFTS